VNSYFAIFHASNLATQITLYICYNERGNFRRKKTFWRARVTVATNASGDCGNHGSKSSREEICNFGKKVALVTGISKFILVAMETVVLRQPKQSYKRWQDW
jgi:hypothetical protein